MPLLATAIAAICVGSQGNYNEACNKAFDAGTRHVGFRQTVDAAEVRVSEIANHNAELVIGKKGLSVVGSGMWLYRSARDRSITIRLPTLGVCDSLNNEITPNSYKLNVQWKF